MGFVQESDAKRVMRLCSEAAEFIQDGVGSIPISLERKEMTFEQGFDHDILGKIVSIADWAKSIERKVCNVDETWRAINIFAKKTAANISMVFTYLGEQKHEFGFLNALDFISDDRAYNLEIEEERRILVESFGESSEAVQEFDAALNQVNADEEAMIQGLPVALQPMFRIKKNLDEIVSLAERNLETEVEPRKGWEL